MLKYWLGPFSLDPWISVRIQILFETWSIRNTRNFLYILGKFGCFVIFLVFQIFFLSFKFGFSVIVSDKIFDLKKYNWDF